MKILHVSPEVGRPLKGCETAHQDGAEGQQPNVTFLHARKAWLRLKSIQESESELRYERRFTDNQFVLVTSPLRLTTSNFIFQLNTCGYSPYVTSSLTKIWVCFLWICLAFRQAYVSHFNYWKFLLLHYTQVLCQPRFWKADHAYLEEWRLLGCGAETSVHTISTERHIPEGSLLHSHR
jgi:hypothetical protein